MAIVLMVIFIILYGISFSFQSSGAVASHTTASFFPRVVLLVAMFLTADNDRSEYPQWTGQSCKRRWRRRPSSELSLTMACAVGFGLGSVYLGTLVSISLFIVATMLVWGSEVNGQLLSPAILTPVLIYLVFNQILLVQLPSGILI